MKIKFKFLIALLVCGFYLLNLHTVYAGHCPSNPTSRATYCENGTVHIDQDCSDPTTSHLDTKVPCSVQSVFGRISPPPQVARIGYGALGLSNFLTTVIVLIFGISGIIFLFMIVIGATQWIMSGGDKEAVAKARSRITHAIIGIVLLSLAFTIAKFVGDLTGFTFFKIGP